MEDLPHDAVINGDWAALGHLFRPLSSDLTNQAEPALIAVNGELPPQRAELFNAADPTSWTLHFNLPVAAWLYVVATDGGRFATAKIAGPTGDNGEKIPVTDTATYTYILVEMITGAYISSKNVAAGETWTVGPDALAPVNNPGVPGHAGPIPTPTTDSPIPPDSPPVLVGAGDLKRKTKEGHDIIAFRTQHWEKSTDSYSLPPCATIAITSTQFSGVTKSSSQLDVVAAHVGVSASVGWGPVSASVSASMSRTTSTTQEVTVTSETESTLERFFSNPYQVGCVVFLWQLVDQLIIATKSGTILAVVETLVLPAIPQAYTPDGGTYPGTAAACPTPSAEGAA